MQVTGERAGPVLIRSAGAARLARGASRRLGRLPHRRSPDRDRAAGSIAITGRAVRGAGDDDGLRGRRAAALEGSPRRRLATAEPLPPPQLRGVRIISAGYHGRTIGALAEDSARRLTAVLACRVPAFALLDPDAQERRLARWGQVLTSAGSSSIRRLQWIERTAPAPGDELARWVHDERDPAVPARGVPLIESYLELIGASDGASALHEVLIAVQIDN